MKGNKRYSNVGQECFSINKLRNIRYMPVYSEKISLGHITGASVSYYGAAESFKKCLYYASWQYSKRHCERRELSCRA